MSQLDTLINNNVVSPRISTIARYRGAVELGWHDFHTRFQRTYFGPLWALFQLAIWVGVLSVVLYDALGEDFGSYVVYLAVGFYVWEVLSSALIEGPGHFTSREALLKNIPITLTNLTIRRVSYIFSRSLFQLPVPVLAILFFGGVPDTTLLLLLLVFPIFLTAFIYGTLVIMGLVGAVYRDTIFLNNTIVRFLFFTTPVFWRGDAGVRKVISDYNPISYFLEFVRAPIEGRVPSLLTWTVVAAISFGTLLIGLWAQSRFRNQLIYWL